MKKVIVKLNKRRDLSVEELESAVEKKSNLNIAVTIVPGGLTIEEKCLKAKKMGAKFLEFKLDDYINLGDEKFNLIPKVEGVKNILTINRPIETNGKTNIDEKTVYEVERLLSKTNIVDSDINYILSQKDREAEKAINKITRMVRYQGKINMISWHDYNGPSNKEEFTKIAKKELELGADILKIVTFAPEYFANLPILEFVQNFNIKGKKIVGWAMGVNGQVSRVLTLLLGGYFSFAFLDKKSASGQLSLSVMEEILSDERFLEELLSFYKKGKIERVDILIKEKILNK